MSCVQETTCLPFDQYQRYRLVADLIGRVRGERGPLFDSLGTTLRGLALVFGYLSAMTWLLAEPITSLLLERGAFDAAAREATAATVAIYALGLVPFAIEALVVPFYFALRDTRTPVLVKKQLVQVANIRRLTISSLQLLSASTKSDSSRMESRTRKRFLN